MASASSNARTIKEPPGNLALWDALSKTDPAHTKPFKRAGGFSGTAIKPIWTIKRLTELFGPVGVGWGFAKPEFQLVPAGSELLVFCTVEAWHGDRANTIYGVGGDKAIVVYGNTPPRADDEAFKKAFTDALGNAFKFVGVGADVHMGQFDDSKYRDEVAREFAPAADAPAEMPDAEWAKLVAMIEATSANTGEMCKFFGVAKLNHLNQGQYAEALEMLNKKLAKLAKAETDKKATFAEELGDGIDY